MKLNQIAEQAPILLEYKRDITLEKMGQKLAAKAAEDHSEVEGIKKNSKNFLEKVLEHIEGMDPTRNNQYTEWLVRQYIRGGFLLEDARDVRAILEKFEKVKKKLTNKDINQYTYGSRVEEMAKHKLDDEEFDTSEDKDVPGLKVLYNGPEGRLTQATTKAASCAIGKGTQWCTRHADAHYYESYAKQGPLYQWVDKDGSKFQFHFESEQFMDIHDRPIPKDKLAEMFKSHPVIKRLFHKYKEQLLKTGGGVVKYAAKFGHEDLKPEHEDLVANSDDPRHPYEYARLKGKRFEKGEDLLMKGDINTSMEYFKTHLPKGEPLPAKFLKAVSESPKNSLAYAKKLKERWEPGEKAIATDAESSINYARDILHGRFRPGEAAIATSPKYAAEYARDILHGRWEAAEDTIESDKQASYRYVYYLEQLAAEKKVDLLDLPDAFSAKDDDDNEKKAKK